MASVLQDAEGPPLPVYAYERNTQHINNCPKGCYTKKSLFIILQVHSTCFGCQPHPSSGGPVPEALVTVLYTPDEGCGRYPKHVE